jgi:hypothetical protein
MAVDCEGRRVSAGEGSVGESQPGRVEELSFMATQRKLPVRRRGTEKVRASVTADAARIWRFACATAVLQCCGAAVLIDVLMLLKRACLQRTLARFSALELQRGSLSQVHQENALLDRAQRVRLDVRVCRFITDHSSRCQLKQEEVAP